MSTAEYRNDFKLADQPRRIGAWPLIAEQGKAFLRALRNRIQTSALCELDDHQLDDIGLTRRDVVNALDHSRMMDDPSRLLAGSARERARDRFRRPARS